MAESRSFDPDSYTAYDYSHSYVLDLLPGEEEAGTGKVK
jgi:hypothetical protein